MNTFREIMGFLLLGTSVWLLDVLSYQSDPGYFSRILIYLLAVTLAAWLYGKLSGAGASTRKRLSGLAAAALIIAGSAIILLGGGTSGGRTDADGAELPAEDRSSSQYADWLEFSPETVYDSIGGQRPVFVAVRSKMVHDLPQQMKAR